MITKPYDKEFYDQEWKTFKEQVRLYMDEKEIDVYFEEAAADTTKTTPKAEATADTLAAE